MSFKALKAAQRVGEVRFIIRSGSSTAYADASEGALFDLFSGDEPEERRRELLSDPDLPWALRYHLSYDRENLLSWYPLRRAWEVLEVGAGCGALTGLFLRRCNRVTALELSAERASVIAHRYKESPNLTVVADNFNTYNSRSLFDIVTFIGVLEYVGKFGQGQQPHLQHLKKARRLLKPGGKLFLAIENRLGLKYWAGAREDHTGRMFESIEGYPREKSIRTFGKGELTELLGNAGYDKIRFFFPWPDYKLPTVITSEDSSDPLPDYLFPAPSWDLLRDFHFNESLASRALLKNSLIGDFANSFLVVAE